ncbi:MAG: hypothetical protein NC322_05270 [Alistipes senegalensis]|nr:hypothetical protein [Alistipes senegalensis]
MAQRPTDFPGNFLRTVLLLLLFGARPGAAQPLGIACCDADYLYDTIPSLFYDDTDYTPQGRLRWNTTRYRHKVARMAALVDSLGLPIVALQGVENEAVVRDISAACTGDYLYLHRTLNTLDGMDFALLYHGDLFFPHYVEPGRRYLYVEGTLRRPAQPKAAHRFRRDTLGLLLCGDARTIGRTIGELRDERPGARMIVMGRLPDRGLERYGLRDAHARAERAGRGNVRSRSGWRMRDRMAVDTLLRIVAGEVYIRRFLLDDAGVRPLPAYERRRYAGGTSRALPIYVYVERKNYLE